MAKSVVNDKLKFEEALQRLEEVLEKLEKSDCPLEEALKYFEQGMELVTYCRDKLSRVEEKISILIKESGAFTSFSGEEER